MSNLIFLDRYFKNYSDGVRKKIISPNPLHGPNSRYYGCYYLSNLEGVDYFLKISGDEKITYNMYAELVAEQLASIVNLKTIDSSIALINLSTTKKPNYKNCLISKDYRKTGYDIYTNKEIVLEYLESLEKDNLLEKVVGVMKVEDLYEDNNYNNINNLSMIWNAYLYHYKDYPNCNDIVENKVMEQVRRYIFRFLIMDKDYHLENSEELDNYSMGISEMSPIYDLEESFSRDFVEKNNSQKMETDMIEDPYEDFENFIKYSDKFYCELAYNMYKLLDNETLFNAIEIVNRNKNVDIPYHFEEEMLDVYKNHYEKVGNILEKYYIEDNSRRR